MKVQIMLLLEGESATQSRALVPTRKPAESPEPEARIRPSLPKKKTLWSGQSPGFAGLPKASSKAAGWLVEGGKITGTAQEQAWFSAHGPVLSVPVLMEQAFLQANSLPCLADLPRVSIQPVWQQFLPPQGESWIPGCRGIPGGPL